jgi:LmbE family N-acetylglucosaminyl deacetylase
MLIRRLLEIVATDITDENTSAPCVVVAPHPDDEVLGCGGTIARRVRQGAVVSIVFLTDGRNGIAAGPEQAIATRQDEARRAGAVLGVSPGRLVFCGFEDGRLGDHIDEAATHVRQMMVALGAQDVFAPYHREYHPDHLAAWRVAAACLRPGMRLYEYPIWYGPWMWRRLGGRARIAAMSHLADAVHAVKIDIGDVADIKRRALGAHQSQLRAFESQRRWDARFLGQFLGNYELFFLRRTPVRGAHLL